jgi:hypothetical protein
MSNETEEPASPALSIPRIIVRAGCFLPLSLVLAATVVLETGCANTGVSRQANEAGAGVAEFRQVVFKVRIALSATLTALDQLTVDADGNLRTAFRRFDESLHQLEVDSVQARARADAIRARGDAYFEEWEEQLSGAGNDQSGQAALERRAQLRRTFGEIRRTSQQAREEFKPFLSNLRDLRVVLGNDLSLTGIDAAKVLILKTQADGRRVERALDEVLAELNSVAAAVKSKAPSKQQP